MKSGFDTYEFFKFSKFKKSDTWQRNGWKSNFVSYFVSVISLETKGILCYQSAFSCGITMEIGKNSSCCHWTSSPTPCAKRLRASAASTWHSKCISWDWRRFGEIDRVGRWLDGDLMAWFDMVWYCLIWLLTKLYAKKPSNLFKFM